MSQRIIFPALIVPVLLAGCFGSHGNGDIDASVRTDAGTADIGGPCDCWCDGIFVGCNPSGTCAGVCPDAGTPDAGPDAGPIECPAAPADLLCDFSHVHANTPTTIPVALQGCYCAGYVGCSAAIIGDRILELSTSDCTDPDVDCDGCNPTLEGTCDIPPLDEGRWQVNVNGQPAFELDAVPEDVLPERGSTCIRRAARDESCGVGWPPIAMEASSACHPTHAWPNERVQITLTDPCGGCGTYAGPCKVDVFDDVIRVQPSTVYSLCDIDCPAVCTPREDVCTTPRLEEGTWRVVFEGLDYEFTVVVGREPAPGHVCGPFFPHG